MTIQFANVEITSIEKKSDCHFTMVDSSGKLWEVKKVILGTGSSDILSQIEGYSVLWKKKIYHCLFCLGYEDRGAESAGVLAVQAAAMMPALAVHTAGNAAQLAKEVTIFTNGSSDVQAQLTPMVSQTLFKMDNREIARLVDASGGVCVEFKDGSSRTVSFLAHHPLTYPQGPFAKQLDLKQSATGDIQADAPLFQTSSRGVFAAGDCITPFKVIPHAIMSGNFAAVAAASQLQAEKYGHASMV